MTAFRKKLIATIGVLTAVLGVLVMAMISGMPLSRAVLGAVRDPSPIGLGLVLNGLVITLMVPFGVFMLSRWSNFADEIAAMSIELKRMLVLIADKSGVQLLRDEASLWAGVVVRMISENPTFLSETSIQMVAGGRYRINIAEARISHFLDRLSKDISLVYIFYLPRKVVGENPAITLLRFTHIIRICRARAAVKGMKLRASVRIIIVNAPRPTGSVFIFNQMTDNVIKVIAREYYRDANPVARGNTPTAERMLLEHEGTAEIAELENLAKRSASQGYEIDCQEVERVIGNLLPECEGGSAPVISSAVWNRVVDQLYKGAESGSYVSVASADHFTIRRVVPSLDDNSSSRGNIETPPPSIDRGREAAAD